jgi:hypothetical protein
MIEERILRTFATELLYYACGKWSGGRSESDPIYREVTESRDVGKAQKSYSSCGDLAHWLLYRLGCRSRFVNRKEHQGWAAGMNVSRLAFCHVAEDPSPNDRYRAGDILIIWSKPDTTDAHVMVALDHRELEPGITVLTSAEYGQPGGAVREHVIKQPLVVGKRTIHRILRLPTVLRAAEEQRLLTEPDYTVLPRAQGYVIEHTRSLVE